MSRPEGALGRARVQDGSFGEHGGRARAARLDIFCGLLTATVCHGERPETSARWTSNEPATSGWSSAQHNAPSRTG